MRIRVGALITIAGVAIALAACTGGGGGNSGLPVTVAPTIAPTSQATTAAVTTAGGTLSLGGVGNGTATVVNSASITLPALSAAGTVSAAMSASGPAAVPTPNAVKRSDALGVTNTPLAYLTLTFAQGETITESPGVTFKVPSVPEAGYAYLVVYAGANDGWLVVSGPVAAAGTMTFAPGAITPLTLTANTPYTFALIISASPVTALNPIGGASYAGTKTIAFSYGYAFGYPTPAPSVTAPPSSTTYAVTSTVSIGSSPNPAANASALDAHTVENDASGLSTTTLTSDAWVANGAAGNSANGVLLYAQTQTEPSSANEPVITTIYGTPQILDELPETSGASWTNSPASTVAYSYASGDNGTRTVNADGTYVDTENLLAGGAGGQIVITENSDASGSIAGPIAGGFVTSIAMSAPSPVPNASPVVNITLAYAAFAQGPPYNYPPSVTIPDDVWYSTNPLSFYSETDGVTTGSLPAACTPNAYGSSANDVQRSITQLDTVIGFEETTTFNSYVINGYPVCLTTADTVSYAYNMQANTPYLIYIGQLGLETQTTTETLVLQNGDGPLPTLRKSATSGTTAGANEVTLALEAHQLASFARARAKLERQVIQTMNETRSKPVVVNQGGRS